jgi:hypothetical protein
VARFIAGELVNVTRNSPNWLKRVFGHELGYEGKHQEVRARTLVWYQLSRERHRWILLALQHISTWLRAGVRGNRMEHKQEFA